MNDTITIEGGNKLTGNVRISSAKNAAVAILPAVVLASEIVKLYDVPNISDIDNLKDILSLLNINISGKGDNLTIDPTEIKNADLLDDCVVKLRASYYFMGALLGRFKHVRILMPGGCDLGPRPIDLHLKGFKALGAKISQDGDILELNADELIGNEIYLDIASVGATINIILAAVFAKGRTVILNAAKEPEIIDLSSMLNKMGAKIIGAGTDEVTIIGVNRLKGCVHEIIPDRIEAGTYILFASAIGENVTVSNVIPQHLDALLSKLEDIGINFEVGKDYVKVIGRNSNLNPVKIKTNTYPGFVTDLQQPITALLTQAEGTSNIKETIYKERFKHCHELNKMGADIIVPGDATCEIRGNTKLKGTDVVATDLRCGAALVLAGLIADGKTVIHDAKHIYRGYDSIIKKLTALGAKIY